MSLPPQYAIPRRDRSPTSSPPPVPPKHQPGGPHTPARGLSAPLEPAAPMYTATLPPQAVGWAPSASASPTPRRPIQSAATPQRGLHALANSPHAASTGYASPRDARSASTPAAERHAARDAAQPSPDVPPPVPPPPARPPSSTSSVYSTDARAPTTPRKRFVVKGARPSSPRTVASPGRRAAESRRVRERPARAERPALSTTLEFVLAPLRLLLAPLQAVLSPVLWHLVNLAILVTLAAALLYLAISYVRGMLLSLVSPGDASLPTTVALLPLRLIATPACLVTNILCPLSLLSTGITPNATAKPFWRLFSQPIEVDVAAVSRELSKEVRNAKDIFDSLQALGDGRMTEGLGHVKIHELGIAIQTGSTLSDRLIIGQELIDLADLASEITDEVVMINTMSVSIFSWLFWEFSHLTQLLALPPKDRPSPAVLSSRLDSLINRLDKDLDRLFMKVATAIPIATQGTEMGWQLLHHLSGIKSDLTAERDRYPGWQKALDISRHFFTGGDPSKLTRISRDLELTRTTISGIDETRSGLERVRIDLIAFRDQVRAFSGSVMGLHLGASESIGLGPEQEMSILTGVVGELGVAVGRAKRRPAEREPAIEGP
ncbi:hypothetical protein Q8F55_006630 [Vanrija albida]|uniref:Plasma membrane fusion protein PRM1 n=1 Tax=Vanrija albida TaxID=181172 RepID=A0ABR3PXN9_9TREE